MSETLYLIDGHAQIFRAYYAIRGGLTSPTTGEPTHATFGFTAMLLKLMREFRPHYAAVAIDLPGKTFRDELYADYKANREKMPEDLSAQIPRILEVTKLFGLPVIGEKGLEADDVIATIVQRVLTDPALADVEIRIVSRDKDLEQLLGDRVKMIDIHKDDEFGVAALREKRGIRPDQVIDLLALTGDTSDNVPGVPGIGPKGAATLLQDYEDIEGIYEHIEEIKGKRRENLEASRELVALSRELVTLKADAEFPFTMEDARSAPPEVGALQQLFQELGFNRFQTEISHLADSMHATLPFDSEEPEPPPPAPATEVERGEYEAVTTPEALEGLAATLSGQEIISFDTETTGLGWEAKLVGLCFAWKPNHGVYVPMRSPTPEAHLSPETVLEALRPVLENPAIAKCGHNLKFDAKALLRAGLRLRGVRFDTMLASTLLDPGQPSQKLDHLAETRLGYRMVPISDLIGERGEEEQLSMAEVPLEQIAPYAAEDADIVLRLHAAMALELQAKGMDALLHDVEAPLGTVLAEMEHCGILCDPGVLQAQGRELEARVIELRQQIFAIAGEEFHLDSTQQLATMLFDQLGFTPVKRTRTGNRSTDNEVLTRLSQREDVNDPRTRLPGLIIEYRQFTKLISTYLGNLRDSINSETGRIHTTFHQLVTATGRLASNAPNLQNIPVRTDVGRRIRRAFIAPPGHSLICADYSQIELRLLAHLSGDEHLREAFLNEQDIHSTVAAEVFGVPLESVTREQRDQAKTINFGIIYGVTPHGLARRIEGLDFHSARRLIEDYKLRFPGISAFLEECVKHALEYGYVTTIMGRRRAIPEIQSPNRSRQSLGERLAINTVVQGSAADLIKTAMVNLQARIDREELPLKLLLQIHDELVLETPEDLAERHADIVREEMEQAMELAVPLRAEAGIGPDWMTAK